MKHTLLSLFLLPIFCFSQSSVEYDITFSSVWSYTVDDPVNGNSTTSLPGNAHWSNLVGAVHNDQITFWEVGVLASPGIEDVAEVGSNTDFFNEVNAQINAPTPTAKTWLQKAVDPFDAIATATLTDVEFTDEFPLVTLATMVAPSPDWFSGTSNYSMKNTDGSWKQTHTIEVFVYDAGTEQGMAYSTSNDPSMPLENIRSLRNMYMFNDNKIGDITFTLKTTLSNTNFDSNKEFKMSPNPSNGNILISEMQNGNNFISIYDVLGKKVYDNTINSTRANLNLTNLKSGLYILKVETENRNISSKKLIIN